MAFWGADCIEESAENGVGFIQTGWPLADTPFAPIHPMRPSGSLDYRPPVPETFMPRLEHAAVPSNKW